MRGCVDYFCQRAGCKSRDTANAVDECACGMPGRDAGCIRAVSKYAAIDLEKLLNRRVHLTLHVSHKPGRRLVPFAELLATTSQRKPFDATRRILSCCAVVATLCSRAVVCVVPHRRADVSQLEAPGGVGLAVPNDPWSRSRNIVL